MHYADIAHSDQIEIETDEGTLYADIEIASDHSWELSEVELHVEQDDGSTLELEDGDERLEALGITTALEHHYAREVVREAERLIERLGEADDCPLEDFDPCEEYGRY